MWDFHIFSISMVVLWWIFSHFFYLFWANEYTMVIFSQRWIHSTHGSMLSIKWDPSKKLNQNQLKFQLFSNKNYILKIYSIYFWAKFDLPLCCFLHMRFTSLLLEKYTKNPMRFISCALYLSIICIYAKNLHVVLD